MKNKILPVLILVTLILAPFQGALAHTTSESKTMVYYEGFNDFWPPFGWTIEQLGTGGTLWAHAVPGYMGNGAWHSYSESDELPNSWLISPPIVLQEDKDFILSFFERNDYLPDYYGYSGVKISIGSGVAGSDDFVEIYESNTILDNYTEKQLPLSAFAGHTIYIAFVYQGSYVHNWFIDEVTVMETTVFNTTLTMLEPEGIGTVTPVPGTYEYGFTEGNAPVVNLNALPGLGSTFGGWTQGNVDDPESPRTSITVAQDETLQADFIPYDEDMVLFWRKHGFQVGAGNSSVSDEDNLETLDNFSNSAIEQITKIVVYGYTEIYDNGFVPWIPENTEPFIVRFYDAPQTALPNALGTPVSEQHLPAKVFRHGTLLLGAQNKTIYKFEIDLETPVSLQSGWVSAQIDLTAGANGWFLWVGGTEGNGNNFSFRRNRNNNTFLVLPHDVNLEIWGTEVQVPQPPSCVAVVSPLDGAENIGYPIGAHPILTLNWQAGPDADGYTLFIGETLPETGIDVGNTTTFSPEGLDFNTTYQWKVVPYNEIGNAVDCPVWTFTTMPDPTIIPPFTVEFIPTGPNVFPPLNWDDRKIGKLTENTQLVHSTSTQWLYMNFAHDPLYGRAARTVMGSNLPVHRWFISPPINLGETPQNNYLFFDMAVTANNTPTPLQLTPQDLVKVVVSTDGGATWSIENTVFELSGANGDQVNPGGQTFSVPVADYQGIIKIGFYVERETASSEIDVFIGNILMFEAYDLTLAANPENGGTVAGAGSFAEGANVAVSASANAGFSFSHWSDHDGNSISTDNPYNFEMPAQNVSLTANFELIDYTFAVTIAPEGSGTATIDPEKEFYNVGEEITLTAIPEQDFAFQNWRRNNVIIGTDPTLEFTMPAQNVSVVAHFVSTIPPTFNLTLTVEPENAGIVTGEGEYQEGSQVQINATANEGFGFINWRDSNGNPLSAQASFQLLMPGQDLTLIAHFQPETSVEALQAGIVRIFPNPARDIITVKSPEVLQRIEIVDLSGRTVLIAEPLANETTLNGQHLTKGIYLIKVITAHGALVSKIMIEK